MTVLFDYWRSSASYRVRIALALADIPYESVAIDLVTGEQGDTPHLARNPQGLVPVLDIDGKRFTQSLAIIEYLDETRSLGLLPNDAADRAHVRALAHAIAMDIHPVCNLRVARFATGQSGGALTMQDWMQHFIAPGLSAYEAMLLGECPFSFGPEVTLSDICLVPQIYNAHRWGVDMSALPRISAIDERLSQHPAFATAHPDRWTS